MKEKIIASYVNMLKKEHISSFALTQGISLNQDEIDIIYNFIKNRYQDILVCPEPVFEEYKLQVRPEVYTKTIELFNLYKKKLHF